VGPGRRDTWFGESRGHQSGRPSHPEYEAILFGLSGMRREEPSGLDARRQYLPGVCGAKSRGRVLDACAVEESRAEPLKGSAYGRPIFVGKTAKIQVEQIGIFDEELIRDLVFNGSEALPVDEIDLPTIRKQADLQGRIDWRNRRRYIETQKREGHMAENNEEQVIESMKNYLYQRVSDWLGFDIPDEGTDDYDTWQSMLLDIDDVRTIEDVRDFFEARGMGDFEELLVSREWDISEMVQDPDIIPIELVENTATKIAHQERECGSWAFVCKYGKWFVSVTEVGGVFHPDVRAAFVDAGIGNDAFDKIFYLKIAEGYEKYVEHQ